MGTMKTTSHLTIRRSEERGHANHGWLNSYHTFSFADYYDPAHMGFRSLRVINQDRIAPLGGFPTHPHRDMEIFSYVVEGQLAHRDSMGNERILSPGDIQLMSAGSGVTHSEYNPSSKEEGHFLQIWIQPEERGLEPSYTEWKPADNSSDPLQLIISHDGRDGSAKIHQDADIYRLKLNAGDSATHEVTDGRGAWIQVIHGTLEVDGVKLGPGDAASTEEAVTLQLSAEDEPVEALIFNLG